MSESPKDKFEELFRMQQALNERIGVRTTETHRETGVETQNAAGLPAAYGPSLRYRLVGTAARAATVEAVVGLLSRLAPREIISCSSS